MFDKVYVGAYDPISLFSIYLNKICEKAYKKIAYWINVNDINV